MFLFGINSEDKVSVADLKRGMKNGEFVFYYQPEFNLKTGEIIAVEALMRWNAPKGIIPPDQFIPVLESSKLIQEFTDFLFRQTLTDLKVIQNAGYPNVSMSVNLSAAQLTDKRLIPIVQTVLKETNTESKFLECEITESQRLEFSDTQKDIFKELQDLGISISIDDFGTGYSSFDYLRYLNINKLKVGCDFARSLQEGVKSREIFSLVIQFGHILKVPVLAEGIETTEQKEWLEKNGCDYGQGFWFSRPLPLDQLIIFLEKKKEN
ncbi:MAG: EAL domain-containing protein [Alphaproteobacteria bacterium]|nr:EAL domain-containing protein [Alphaproteobacteria bacterium]